MAQDTRKQADQDRARQNPEQGGQGTGQGHNPHRDAIGDRGSKRQQNDPQRQPNPNDEVDDDQDLMEEDRDDEDSMTDKGRRGPSGAGA